MRMIRKLKCDQWPRQASLGAIQKQAQTQRLCALHSHQPHLPPDMVDIVQHAYLRFVPVSVSFQPRNPFFDAVAKPRADLKSIMYGAVGDHGVCLVAWEADAKEFFLFRLKFFPSAPIIAKTYKLRQITV
jgi:hypothetical protein